MGRVKPVLFSTGGGSQVFWQGKKLHHVASINIQAKLPVKINLNYSQVSKNLYKKNYLLPTDIIVSLDPCPLSPKFGCFRAGFWYKIILGDPGADSGDEEKYKRAEKYMARRKVKNGE